MQMLERKNFDSTLCLKLRMQYGTTIFFREALTLLTLIRSEGSKIFYTESVIRQAYPRPLRAKHMHFI